ncbi:hypothetical protein CJO71_06725 [Burkholderia ubonensis]|nr:hypothetical protein CJO71_06725 [Burkholderia ubonensis]PAJ88465.1 hypothetical protein CJO70_06535 [Burkholderia ubonensis]
MQAAHAHHREPPHAATARHTRRLHPERGDRLAQRVSLRLERLRRRCGLLDERRVLLRRLIELRDRDADQLDPAALPGGPRRGP